jgi:hypothetical protein
MTIYASRPDRIVAAASQPRGPDSSSKRTKKDSPTALFIKMICESGTDFLIPHLKRVAVPTRKHADGACQPMEEQRDTTSELGGGTNGSIEGR